jgi:hypothetical protein
MEVIKTGKARDVTAIIDDTIIDRGGSRINNRTVILTASITRTYKMRKK